MQKSYTVSLKSLMLIEKRNNTKRKTIINLVYLDRYIKYSILKNATLPCAKAILDLKVEGC